MSKTSNSFDLLIIYNVQWFQKKMMTTTKNEIVKKKKKKKKKKYSNRYIYFNWREANSREYSKENISCYFLFNIVIIHTSLSVS